MSYPKQDLFFPIGSSATHSGAVYMGDFRNLSIQVSGSGSNFTIEGSNDDGFTRAITNWSTMTVLTAAGIYSIEAGARWIRAGRPDSAVTIAYHGFTVT